VGVSEVAADEHQLKPLAASCAATCYHGRYHRRATALRACSRCVANFERRSRGGGAVCLLEEVR
jgi:hypothetical protein